MKKIHAESQSCNFLCGSCNNSFIIETTLKKSNYSVDVCSKCHPFYIGKTTGRSLSGRLEKLQKKFEIGKERMITKVEKPKKVRKAVDSFGFDKLKIKE